MAVEVVRVDGSRSVRYRGLRADRAEPVARDLWSTGGFRQVDVRNERTGFVRDSITVG